MVAACRLDLRQASPAPWERARSRGSETEHCAPGSQALSLLATPRLSEGLGPHQSSPWTPWPYLIGLESARAGSQSLISCPRPSGQVWIKPERFCPRHCAKAFCAFSPCLKTTPADGRYYYHLCLTDEKT